MSPRPYSRTAVIVEDLVSALSLAPLMAELERQVTVERTSTCEDCGKPVHEDEGVMPMFCIDCIGCPVCDEVECRGWEQDRNNGGWVHRG